MKLENMQAVIRATPHMAPLFRVTAVSPRLARLGVAKGDTFYYHPNGCWVPVQSKCVYNTSLGATQVEFIEYTDTNKQGALFNPNIRV